MTKKVIAFDLDDTLSITKSPISDRMSEILSKLLDKYEVCIISGGKFEQFKMQVLDQLESTPRELSRMHLMTTCGTRYFRYDESIQDWKMVYSNDLTEEQKSRVIKSLEEGARKLGLWEENPHGNIIEDRGSQVTFSALGQQAPAELKYKWDPTGEKKMSLRDYLAPLVPDLEVRVGGTTSVDVTMVGVDKAYGMNKLCDELNITKEEILFIGDKLQQGGNDYPVKAMGIDTIEVNNSDDTIYILEGVLAVTQ